ncbi:MAG: HEPN domain-containing protein [Isosphaeraceae bacterium]
MATPVDLARGWMQKGDSDRLNADRTAPTTGPYDTACFHAQQAAEKYLRAVLALAGSPIPRTHDPEDIYDGCLAVAPALVLDRMELSTLTPYAVQLRYDMGFWPDQPTVQHALATVDRVRAAVLSFLPPTAQP